MVICLAFIFIFLSRILFLSISPAFFDSLEYIRLFELSSPIEALGQAHLPVHPFWITTGWLFNKIPLATTLYKIEFLNGILGALSCWLIYQIAREFTDKNKSLLISMICAFTPYFWLSQVNVLYEPLFAVFLLGSFYFFIKKKLFLSTVFFSGSFLISTTVLVYLIFFVGFLLEKKDVKKFAIPGMGLVFGGLGYLYVLKIRGIPGRDFFSVLSAGNGFWEKVSSEGVLFFARGIRNSLAVYFNYLTVPVGIITICLGCLRFFKKQSRIIIFSGAICFLLLNTVWHAGMFGRLSLLLSLALVFLLIKFNEIVLKIILLFLIVYSSFIVLPYRFQKIPYVLEKESLEQEGENFYLVMSNFEEPYLKETAGEYRVLNSPKTDLKEIKGWLEKNLGEGRKILTTSQAISAPYFQYDGMNFHILSKRKKYPLTQGEKLLACYNKETIKDFNKRNLQIYLIVDKVEQLANEDFERGLTPSSGLCK